MRRFRSAVLLALAVSLLGASAADALTLTVTNTADEVHGACTVSLCSLRDAFAAAHSSGVATTISLPAGTYDLTHEELTVAPPDDITLHGAGAGATMIVGQPLFRVLRVFGGQIDIAGVTLAGGSPVEVLIGEGERGVGGAIWNEGALTLEDAVLSGSIAVLGGAIFNAGQLDVVRSLITGNQSTYQGGALENVGSATIADSTIAGNEVDSQLTYGEEAPGGGEVGGAIANYGALHLQGDTIAANALSPGAPGEGAGIVLVAGSVTAGDSIVAENTGSSQCLAGTATSTAPNIDSDGSCFTAAGDLHADPLLGALASNGGPTETLALGPLSPAASVGEACDAFDQRGEPRPAEHCSLGAFQYAPAARAAEPPSRQTAVSPVAIAGAPTTTIAPAGRISVRVATLAGGRVGVLVTTPGAGQLEATATEQDPSTAAASSLSAGRGRFAYSSSAASSARAGTTRLTLAPNPAGRAIIRRHHRYGWALNVRVTILFRPPAGHPSVVTRYARIFAAAPHRH